MRRAFHRVGRRGTASFLELLLRHLLLLMMVALASGCASRGGLSTRPLPRDLAPGSPLLDPTLPAVDAWLRHHESEGQLAQALALLDSERTALSDELVAAMQRAVLLHRVGAHEVSAELLDWAAAEIERRYTISTSRALLSMITNDAALAYTPGATERAMVPFYGMLARWAANDLDGAMVEARRANALIAASDPGARLRACNEHAMLSYLAGLVLDAGGASDEAIVSLRLAEAAFAQCGGARGVPRGFGRDLRRVAIAAGLSEVADSAAARYGAEPIDPSRVGDILVVIEGGYIAHRTEGALHVPVFPEELDALEGDAVDVTAVAASIAARMLEGAVERSVWGSSFEDVPAVQVARALGGAYVMRLAWPMVADIARRDATIDVVISDSVRVPATEIAELSSLARADLADQRPEMLTRLVIRGLTKFLASREIERKAEERGGELAGFFAGRLANLAAHETERADTRHWSLLPDRVAFARLQLSPGTHDISLEVDSGEGTRRLELRDIVVRREGLTIVSARLPPI